MLNLKNCTNFYFEVKYLDCKIHSADVQIKFIKIWHSEMIFIKYIKPALNYQQIKFWKGSHTISLLSFDLWNHDILNWFSDNIKQTSCRVTLSMDTRFVSLGFVKTRFPAIKMQIFWGQIRIIKLFQSIEMFKLGLRYMLKIHNKK